MNLILVVVKAGLRCAGGLVGGAKRGRVPDSRYDLRRLQRASQRVTKDEARLAETRDAFYVEIRAARRAGVSIADVARTVGVSRQRMQQLLARLEKR